MWKTVDELVSDSLVFSEVNVTSLYMQVRRKTMVLSEEDRNQWLSVQYILYISTQTYAVGPPYMVHKVMLCKAYCMHSLQ